MVLNVDKRKYTVYLSLGTNLGDKIENLRKAIDFIKMRLGEVKGVSAIYETESWGNEDLKPFYNQVLKLETYFEPQELIEKLLAIEIDMGRVRSELESYIDRLIDLDILLIDQLIIKSKNLLIPHPYLHERNFVLVPLKELSPQLSHPQLNKSVLELLNNCEDSKRAKKVELKD